MQVVELWRYPVKSMPGEPLATSAVDHRGLAGDRQWALRDDGTDLVLTARRVPDLLLASVTAAPGRGPVHITLPDGRATVGDPDADAELLSGWLGRPVRVVEAGADPGTYEIAIDFEDEAGSEWIQWQGPAGSFHDSTRTQVSIVSQDSLGSWDVRRFRPNVVVEGAGEDALIGHRVRIGDTELDVVKAVDRCVVTTRAQRGGIEHDLDVLRTINRERAGNLAIGALVVHPGTVTVGDELVDLGPIPT